MRHQVAIFALLLSMLATMAFAGLPENSAAQDSTDERVSVLETQVAELEATVAALAGNSTEGATEPQSDDSDGDSDGIDIAVEEAPAADGSAENLSGNAFELLPPGNAGEFAVVSSGIYDGMSLPLLLRNNTEEALVRASVSVSVHDAAGALLAVGQASDVTPARIEPGGYAFGSAFFDFATFPSDVTYEFQASGESADSASFIGTYDVTIQESSYLGDRIVGTATNDQSFELQGPIGVNAACIGSDGSLLGISSDFAPAETAAPGSSIPFQVSIYNVASCDLYLIGGKGFHF